MTTYSVRKGIAFYTDGTVEGFLLNVPDSPPVPMTQPTTNPALKSGLVTVYLL